MPVDPNRESWKLGMDWARAVEDIGYLRSPAAEMGGPERVARQHAGGRYAVRERIDKVVDPGSFVEAGPLVGAAEYDEDGNLRAFTPGAYVMGVAEIDGRPVAVEASGHMGLPAGDLWHQNVELLRRVPVAVRAGRGRPAKPATEPRMADDCPLTITVKFDKEALGGSQVHVHPSGQTARRRPSSGSSGSSPTCPTRPPRWRLGSRRATRPTAAPRSCSPSSPRTAGAATTPAGSSAWWSTTASSSRGAATGAGAGRQLGTSAAPAASRPASPGRT